MDYDEHILKEAEQELQIPISDESLGREITFVIIGIIGIAANALLIYMICRFPKLQTNVFLIHFAVADIGSTLSTITCFEIFLFNINVPYHILFLYEDVNIVMALIVTAFMMLLTAEWCLSAHFSRLLDQFQKYTNIIVASVWVFFAIYLIAIASSTEESDHFYTFAIVLYVLLASAIIILHTIRAVKKYKGAFQYSHTSIVPLMVPTIFVLCWLLNFISLILLLYFDVYSSAMTWITDPPGFLHPMINLAFLVVADQDFRESFHEVLKSCGLFKPRSQNTIENNSSDA